MAVRSAESTTTGVVEVVNSTMIATIVRRRTSPRKARIEDNDFPSVLSDRGSAAGDSCSQKQAESFCRRSDRRLCHRLAPRHPYELCYDTPSAMSTFAPLLVVENRTTKFDRYNLRRSLE